MRLNRALLKSGAGKYVLAIKFFTNFASRKHFSDRLHIKYSNYNKLKLQPWFDYRNILKLIFGFQRGI